MAILDIIIAPDPRLKITAEAVDAVGDDVRKLMDDGRRVIVIDVAGPEEDPNPIRMANPEILWESDDENPHEEGCLSLPTHYAKVVRPDAIKVSYLDHGNEIRELEADGVLATCIQHEMDHLEGILFVDRISTLKRGMILRKLAKEKKLAAAENA